MLSIQKMISQISRINIGKNIKTTRRKIYEIEDIKNSTMPNDFGEINMINILYILVVKKSLIYFGARVDSYQTIMFFNSHYLITNRLQILSR